MDENAAWETAKENVLPLKRGRATKGLAERVEYNHLGSEQSLENGIYIHHPHSKFYVTRPHYIH